MHRLALVGLVAACSFPQKHGGASSGDAGSGSSGDASQQNADAHEADAHTDGSGVLGCANDPFPTTAPATLQIGGTVSAQMLQAGTSPAPGVTIQLFGSNNNVLFTTTTSNQGQFSGQAATGSRAIDGQLTAQGPSGQGYLPTIYLPREPFAMDTPNVAILVITQSNLTTLYQLFGVAYNANDGTVLATIVDCDGNAVPGAQLTVTPPAGVQAGRIYYMRNGLPDTSAGSTDGSGQVIVLDEPPLPTVFTATTMGVGFHQYTIGVAGNAVTMVGIQPGAPSP